MNIHLLNIRQHAVFELLTLENIRPNETYGQCLRERRRGDLMKYAGTAAKHSGPGFQRSVRPLRCLRL